MTLETSDHCQQLDELEINCELFQQTLNEQINHPEILILIQQIDNWECNSIEKIQQTAKECRENIFQETNKFFHQMEINLAKLNDQMREYRQENVYNENDLNYLKQKLTKLEKDLHQISKISIQQDSTSFINKISVIVFPSFSFQEQSLSSSCSCIDLNTKWKQNGFTVAGGNEKGHGLNQLSCPFGIYVDNDDQCIYIADCENHRIVQWKYDTKSGQIVAGAAPSQLHIMNKPTDVIVDKLTDSLIICDWENKRVVRWPRRNSGIVQTIIADINCWGVAMNHNGDLYVSDCKKHEVRRWKAGETNRTIVAGGNGKGDNLNQLNLPTHLFVDEECSVYVSDNYNHRVMKWIKDSNEGIIVAGGQGQGDSLSQLSYPQGVIVDHMGNVYVADSGNHRIMRWSKGSLEGQIIVGGNGKGEDLNQFSGVDGLSFDRQGNIYAVDSFNHRVQKFEIDLN